MECLSWTNGDRAVRSSKKEKDKYIISIANIEETKKDSEGLPDSKKGTSEYDNPDIEGDYKLSNIETIHTTDMTDNRREIYNDKLSNRTYSSKAGSNPFLSHLIYSNDILQQERFLIPKNSNMEKEYNQ